MKASLKTSSDDIQVPAQKFELNFSIWSLLAILIVIISHVLYSFAIANLIMEELRISEKGNFTWIFIGGTILLLFYSLVNLQRMFIVYPDKNKIEEYLYPRKNLLAKDGTGTVKRIAGFYPRNFLKAPHLYIFPFLMYLIFWSVLILYYLLFAYSVEIGTTAEVSGIIFSIIIIASLAGIGFGMLIYQYRLGATMIVIYEDGFVLRNGFKTIYFPIIRIKEVIQWVREDGIQNLTFFDLKGFAFNINVKGLPYSRREELKISLTEYLDNIDKKSTSKYQVRKNLNRTIINSRKINYPMGSIRGRTGRW